MVANSAVALYDVYKILAYKAAISFLHMIDSKNPAGTRVVHPRFAWCLFLSKIWWRKLKISCTCHLGCLLIRIVIFVIPVFVL